MDKRLLQLTIDTWQPLSEKKLTEEDTREIIENVVNFMELLIEWDEEEKRKNPDKTGQK